MFPAAGVSGTAHSSALHQPPRLEPSGEQIMPDPEKTPSTTEAADAIQATKLQPQAPDQGTAPIVQSPEGQGEEVAVDASWQVEEWRERFILVRHERVTGSP